MTDTTDELRIIARDGAGRLSLVDRAAIVRAAEELELACRQAEEAQAMLLEVNAHRIALADRVRDLQPKQPIVSGYGPYTVRT